MKRTYVVFKKFPEGDVIALFPLEAEKDGMILSYQHMGEHAAADAELLTTLPQAAPEEYASIKRTLEQRGYDLHVVQCTHRGTYYHEETPAHMVALLEQIRERNLRVRFHWGDAATGEDWGDVHDVEGTLSRSMGPIKVPILIANSRSTGGGAILDHCIVKIALSKEKELLWKHPNYHQKKEASK